MNEETELHPEFVHKMRKIDKEKSIRVNDFEESYNIDV